MFKSFAAAIAPIVVLGRGTSDGTSAENAIEVDLIPDVLKLYTYNQDNEGNNEFHGDLWYAATSTSFYTENVEFGFCIRKAAVAANATVDPPVAAASATSPWDCMQVRTGANISQEPDYLTNFTLKDKYFTGTPSVTTILSAISEDADAIEIDTGKNWRSIPGKSYKTNCQATGTSGFYCQALNAHFYRDFVTNSETQDLQLTEAMAGMNFDVVGWTTSYAVPTYTGNPYKARIGSIVQTKAVSKVFVDAKVAAAAQKVIDDANAAAAAAQKVIDDAKTAADLKAAEEAAAKLIADAAAAADGASSVTTYASALIAVVYALAF